MKQWKKFIPSFVWIPLIIAQIVLVFIFGFVNEAGYDAVRYLGWIIWLFSIIFGWLPIYIFKRKGGVTTGKSYVHTTVIVDTGLYSIIRHPQYTAGILFSLSLILISQNWLITIMGVAVIIALYIDIIMADTYEIEKFGDDYKRYMKKVPRTNFFLGIIRLIRRKISKKNDEQTS